MSQSAEPRELSSGVVVQMILRIWVTECIRQNARFGIDKVAAEIRQRV